MNYESLEEVMYCLEVATESSLSVDDYRQDIRTAIKQCLALKNLDSKTQGYVKKNDINKARATLQLYDSRLIKTSNCSPVHYKSAHKEESSYRI